MESKWVRTLLVALVATVAFATQLQAQTGSVRGRVVAADLRNPLSDVTVTVAGQTEITDAGGRFVIDDVPAGVHTIRATFIGYNPGQASVTVLAGQTADVEIEMQVAPVQLETLVAVGYGQQEKKDLTGVVQAVEPKDFNTGRIVSPEQLITAKVAGVNVTQANGGEPGGDISIRIRGGTSVNATNEPLFVIDGVPIAPGGGLSSGRNPLNFMNPDDIASFTVLKDASATAIYGSQGGNGVILIETKSGKGATAGAGPQMTFRGTFSGSNVTANTNVLTASQFRTAVQAQTPDKVSMMGDASNDWRDLVQQSAFGQEYSAAVQGAGEKMNFRVSLGYLNQEGVVQASRNERISLNVGYNQLLFKDRLRLQANVQGGRNKDWYTPGGVLGSATAFDPTQSVYEAGSPYGGYFEWPDFNQPNNPVAQLNQITDKGQTWRSVGNLTVAYDLPWIDGLTATARGGYVVTNSERRSFEPSYSKGQEEVGNYGTINVSTPNELSYLFEGFGTWQKAWTDNSFDVTGGYSYQTWNNTNPSYYAQQLSSDLLGIYGVPAANIERTFETVDEFKTSSWFARANYGYKDRYLLTGSIRTDGASKFGTNNQWATFPAVAAAWRLSQEDFMSSADWLSDLKLRLSWGQNGNQAFPSYRQYKTYVYGDPLSLIQFGDQYVSTVRPSAVDPNIKWEQTSSWDAGFDYGLWNQRLNGSVDFYTKKTDDLIFNVPVAAGSNLSNYVYTNVGSMRNKGFELTVNYGFVQPDNADSFSWQANFNFAYNHNELLQINPFIQGSQQILVGSISGGVGSTIELLRPGDAINSFYVYEHRMSGGKPIYEDTNGDGTINEQDLYVDQNGDGIINQDDRRVYHSPDPAWIIGHTSLMRYRKWDLSFTLLAHLGNYVYNNVSSSTGFYDQLRDNAGLNNMDASVLESQFQTPQYFSDWYVEDASFLRLNNIELGYTFSSVLRGMRVYGVVQNLFTITGYDGIDPLAGINGIDNNIYPFVRTFTAGVTMTF